MRKCVQYASRTLLLVVLSVSITAHAQKEEKTYKHASEYQVAVLDQSLRIHTGQDVTIARTGTDAKMGPGGQGMHILHTNQGNYRVEAPVNKGLSFMSAMSSLNKNATTPATTFHNKWFLDNVAPGTRVLFAVRCATNKKHPNATDSCVFWFPDPDSTSHEYETVGDFTPYLAGDGSNIEKTADTLCGTGKLNPATEAELCGGAPVSGVAPPPLAPQRTAPSAPPAPPVPPTQAYPCGAGSQCAPIEPR